MNTIFDRYSRPRDAVPEILEKLYYSELNGGKINESLNRMGITAEDSISFLLLEVSRLNNNLSKCRRAAKQALENNEVVEPHLNHIVDIVDGSKHSVAWY
jgi:hypothetical protein